MNEAQFHITAPREVALAILDARFGRPAPRERAQPDEVATLSTLAPLPAPEAELALAEFQRDAVERLTTILHARRGAVLADSVGLGKTHVAAAIIRSIVRERGAVLVTGPASLADHWRRHLRGVRGWRWCSHTSLARSLPAPGSRRNRTPWSLIVVDEAHAFRNPRTQRYHALARACAGSAVLLLTATPVNNSPFDLYHLLRLFADDGAFADVGVPHLAGAFTAAAAGRTRDVRRIAEAVVVRRTRDLVQHGYHADERLRFPTPARVRALPYDIDASCDGRFDMVLAAIAALRFPAHAPAGELSIELMRMSLLKRIESGSAALAASVRRLIRITDAHARAARQGFLLTARDYADLMGKGARTDQLLLDAAVLERLPPDLDRDRVIGNAETELRRLGRIADWCTPERDAKVAALAALLDGELRDERVLVFTEYRETAVALWRALRGRVPTALLHGTGAFLGASPASRQTVIRRFAPHASGSRPPPAREQVQLLIATDVAAEGLNLQDARVVISFDLPWNPVRLAQRIGRIDRLGSPHTRVEAFSFTPDHRLEALLGLLRRLRRKIRSIRSIGGDAPRLAACALPDELALVETLRIEHRRARVASTGRPAHPAHDTRLAPCTRDARDTHETCPGAPRNCHTAGTPVMLDQPPPAAAMQVRGPGRAVVLCFAADNDIRCRTVRSRPHRRAIAAVDLDVDRILIEALARTDVLPVDTVYIARMARLDRGGNHHGSRKASHTNVSGLAGADRTGPPSTQRRTSRGRAAGLVHQWLQARQPAPSTRDCGRADRLLALLRAPAGVHLEHRLSAALDGRGTLEDRFERLESAVRAPGLGPSAPPAGCGAVPRRRWRLVAALELLVSLPVAR